ARIEGELNRLESILGQNVDATVPPPVWATSVDPAQPDADVAQLLDVGALTPVVAMPDHTDAGQPRARAGDPGLSRDSTGPPQALVRTAAGKVAETPPQMPHARGRLQGERLKLLYPRRRKRRSREHASR